MLKRFLLSSSVLIIFTLYAIRLHSRTDEEVGAITINTSPPVQTTTTIVPTPVTVTGSTSPTPVKTVSPQTPKPSGKYKDGTYTGSVADAFYGNVQVQAIVSGGRITDVKFLQYPNDRQTSIEINSQAMPMLTQEAIQVQSAQVDGVSGASATSAAFIQSLGDALRQAI